MHLAAFTDDRKFGSTSGLAPVSQNIFSAHPNLNSIYAASQQGDKGAGRAVAAAKLQGKSVCNLRRRVRSLVADVKMARGRSGRTEPIQDGLRQPESYGRGDSKWHEAA